MQKKIKLMNLVIDPTIQVREVDSRTVSQYRQAMRAGAKFPSLEVEAKTNRVICGNHRYYAYKGLLKPEDTIPCNIVKFKNELELIKHAARDNARHGRPLCTWDKKRIIQRLINAGAKKEEVSEILNLTVKKIKELAGLQVVVIGQNKKKTYQPVKHGLEHLKGQTVTEKQYTEHAERDRGVSAKSQIKTLIRWISNGWITKAEDLEALQELRAAIDGMVKKAA